MAAVLRKTFPDAQVDIAPGGRGEFTVTADGNVLWDKHERGRFPNPDEILDALRSG